MPAFLKRPVKRVKVNHLYFNSTKSCSVLNAGILTVAFRIAGMARSYERSNP